MFSKRTCVSIACLAVLVLFASMPVAGQGNSVSSAPSPAVPSKWVYLGPGAVYSYKIWLFSGYLYEIIGIVQITSGDGDSYQHAWWEVSYNSAYKVVAAS